MTWRTEQDRAFYVYDDDDVFVCNARDKKTARAIAALPDLLDALHKARAWIAPYEHTAGYTGRNVGGMLRVIDVAMARAARDES